VHPILGRKDRGVIAFLLALVVARLGFAAFVYARPNLALANDTDRYVPIANAILAGHAYAWSTDHPGELLNTVGYPLFLAGAYWFLGRGAGGIAAAQLLLSGILVLSLYFFLARAVGSTPALISATLLALDPLSILWSMTVLTETLFAALLGLGALTLTSWASSGRTRLLVLAGLFCGLACLVKPYAELIVVLWGAALLFFPGHAQVDGEKWTTTAPQRVLAFLTPAVLLIAPWIVRNSLLWHCPTLSSVDRVTMRDYVAAKVLSEYQHITLEAAQSNLQESNPGVCPGGGATYWKIVLSHPQIYARLHLAGTIPVLLGTSFDQWLQFLGVDYSLPDLFQPFMDGGLGGVAAVLKVELGRYPLGLGLMIALMAFQGLLYALALLGVLSLKAWQSPAIKWNIIILTAAALILVVTPGQGGHERFRVPVQPLLMILAGYGLAWRLPQLLARSGLPRSTEPVAL
jgi:4-amino-4-deoxy-L-arabinose transferase-like glycosyltransferase